MNKLLIFTSSVLLLFSGCMRQQTIEEPGLSTVPPANSYYPDIPEVDPIYPDVDPVYPETNPIYPETNPVYPDNNPGNNDASLGLAHVKAADAAMYRGIITSVVTGKDGLTTLTLKQVSGTDFGAGALKVVWDESTKTDLKPDDLADGNYIEVFYGRSPNADMPEKAVAISLKKLPDADLSIFNGTIIDISRDKKNKELGSLTLKALDGEQEIVFNYGPETQIYLDADALKNGDKLNVFFSGATTNSLPPRAYALEIRPYAEA
jgi:hypothetical protein